MNKDDKPATGIMEDMTDEANKQKQFKKTYHPCSFLIHLFLLLIHYIFPIQFDTFNCCT